MSKIYSLKVIRKKTKPVIWYRIKVPEGITFSVLSLFLDILTDHVPFTDTAAEEADTSVQNGLSQNASDTSKQCSEAQDAKAPSVFSFTIITEKICLMEDISDNTPPSDFETGLQERNLHLLMITSCPEPGSPTVPTTAKTQLIVWKWRMFMKENRPSAFRTSRVKERSGHSAKTGRG